MNITKFVHKCLRSYRLLRWAKLAENIRIVYKNTGAKKLAEEPKEAIDLVWFNQFINFGDALSPIIVKCLSGKKIKRAAQNVCGEASGEGKQRLIALGTILHFASDGDMVWGAGFRGFDNDGNIKVSALDVRAVRGPLTRKFLLQHNINCPDIYGDPAILMPHLFRPGNIKKYDIGIVPHYNDITDFSSFLSSSVTLISVRNDALDVIRKICECKIILTSSLHALILAESYAIPACWMFPAASLWEGWQEPAIKYEDYYLSTRRDPIAYTYGRGNFQLDVAVKKALNTAEPYFNRQELLMSFPFLRKDILRLEDLDKYVIDKISYNLTARDYYQKISQKLANARLRKTAITVK